VGVNEGVLRGKEWGEQFYQEAQILLPCSENLREGLVGRLGDGLGWLGARRIQAHRAIVGSVKLLGTDVVDAWRGGSRTGMVPRETGAIRPTILLWEIVSKPRFIN